MSDTFARSIHACAAMLAMAVLGAGCAGTAGSARSTPARPVPGPPPPVPEAAQAPPARVVPEVQVPPISQRLPWINPARCLAVCTMDPSPRLVRVDREGGPDEHGHHQVLDEVQGPLYALLLAARAAGHAVRIESAFRSYEDQARLYRQVREIGRAARPGHSEHQLGSAVDLRLPTGAALLWLADHAAEFGFVLSYPEEKQRLTGYRPEPWHVRFVGTELAQELHRAGRTLEELFRARPGLGESGDCADCPDPSSQAPCGEVTEAGTCAGNVLRWCYDGALAAVDCGSSGQQCGAGADGRADCLSGRSGDGGAEEHRGHR